MRNSRLMIATLLAATGALDLSGPPIAEPRRPEPTLPPPVDENEARKRRHMPHQGKQEIERRRRQMERQALKKARASGNGTGDGP